MEKERFKPELSIDSITDEQWADALWATAKKITYMVGNPEQGPFSERVLGIPAKDYFSQLAFEVLFTGKKPLNNKYTLARQMCLVAHGLMSNHAKLSRNNIIVDAYDDYKVFLMDSLLNTEMDPLDEERYNKAELVAGNDDDLKEFVRQLHRCETYEDVAEEMGIPIEQVYNLTRKLRRHLSKAGYLEKNKKQ